MRHSAKDVLIVDKTMDRGFQVLSLLELENADVTVISQAVRAIKTIRKKAYDLIILGDKLAEGDTYDVGLELKTDQKNRRTAVLCVGNNKSRATKLSRLLGDRALMGKTEGNIKKLKEYLVQED